jgi:hypothetical protein
MLDLLYLALSVAFFALSWAFAELCAGLGQKQLQGHRN